MNGIFVITLNRLAEIQLSNLLITIKKGFTFHFWAREANNWKLKKSIINRPHFSGGNW